MTITRAENSARARAHRKGRAAPIPHTADPNINNDITAPTIDRRAEFTLRAGADGNALPAIRPEQQHVAGELALTPPQPAAARSKPAKPVKSTKPSKPAKPKRRRRRKAARKSPVKSRARPRTQRPPKPSRKSKPSPRSAIPKFQNSSDAPPAAEPQKPDEPTEHNNKEQTAAPAKDNEPRKNDEPPRKDDKPQRTAQQTAEEETCRGHAYDRWAQQIIAHRRDMIQENIGSLWPPANAELHEAIAKAPDDVARLAEEIARERGYSLKAADFRYTKPRELWRILKHYWPRYGNQSSEQFDIWVAETVERFQSEFLRQEQFRRLDDLDDEERRIEHDIDAALDRAVEKAARDFDRDTAAICDALTEGFRNHPKLAEIVDDVPGKIIAEIGDEFRVTADPYSVWARTLGLRQDR